MRRLPAAAPLLAGRRAHVQVDVQADVQHASSITKGGKDGGTIAATALGPAAFHPRHSVATPEITLSLALEDRGAEAVEVEVVTHTLGGGWRPLGGSGGGQAPSSQKKAPSAKAVPRRCAARKV